MKRPFLQLPNEIARCPDLTPSEFRVLIALMSVKPCFPSHSDLSNWTGLDKKTVNRALQALKEKGVVSWKKGNSYGRNNQYFIHQKEKWVTTPKIGYELPPKTGIQNRLISNKDLESVPNFENERIPDDAEIHDLLEKLNKIG